MKKLGFLALAIAGMLFAACSSDKDVAGGPNPNPNLENENQFLAFNINLPSVPTSMRAADNTATLDDGLPGEYSVKNAILLVFSNEADEDDAFDLDDAVFAGRTIAPYQENPTATVSQAKFIGSYVDVYGIAGGSNKMWWKNTVGNFVVATEGGVAVPFKNYSFHAYLELDPNFNASEARIFVQEADGSTTAINTVTGEQQNFAKGAWYTINGMKVNGVPTEKGIYINNGKKVVIK